jgi:two-component system, chemotaxis family, protein-glutamate methylesterase/glutaminase
VDPISSIRSDTTSMPNLLIVIGTSTGGPQALTTLFSSLPVISGAACLIVQHMPKGFTANLTKRLNHLSKWHVKEAENEETIEEGVVYVAPGGYQLRVQNSKQGYLLTVLADGPVNGHQPSVDSLFCSVAEAWKESVIGVIMTGMGKDGAIGLKEIRNRGGYTIAESESSCVVYGMPKAAVSLGAAMVVTPLADIASAIIQKSNHLDNLGKRSVRSDT